MRERSMRRIAANRRNAQRSTGPRTPQGKARVSQNARTHGIFSTVATIPGEEDPEEFRRHAEGLRESWKPVGYHEELEVDHLAEVSWRLRRATRFECGVIGPRQAVARRQYEEALAGEVAVADSRLDADQLKQSSAGINILIGALHEAEAELIAGGVFSSSTAQWLCETFQYKLEANGATDQCPSVEQQKARARQFLATQETTLRRLKAQMVEREALERQAVVDRAALPPERALDRIVRYATMLERTMDRIIMRLERSQRLRQGDVMPAPLAVDITHNVDGGAELVQSWNTPEARLRRPEQTPHIARALTTPRTRKPRFCKTNPTERPEERPAES